MGGTDKLLKDADLEIKSFERRDRLRGFEKSAQKLWEKHRVFEVDPDEKHADPKYLITFPYPYMNGVLHVGHAFTLSKAEFAAGFQRLLGKRVCFPFGFHCTGMPIAAAAKKISREMELFGNPPNFPVDNEDKDTNECEDKGIKKKGKIEKKKSAKKYQWQILEEMGVPSEEISKFADPLHWLHYFPPIAVDHLKEFGLKADWRRSFITTAVNPYYDAFIRWQFNTLRKLGLIDFGKRISVFSPSDNQPCADHDRETGEGVGPQEYTGIKMELLQPFPKALEHIKDKRVYLIAATLRPETMYGQTNCWILPRGEYGAFEMASGEIFICSERSALNMSYQDLTVEAGKLSQVAKLQGWDLLGKAVKSPNATFEKLYVLPLLTISMDKGTGIVTSVPSDAPDDYIALKDLRESEELRNKYYISLEMVAPFDPVPIIDIPDIGNLAAVKLCHDLGVKNQHDRVKLDQAKETAYKLGFARGTMLIGVHKGEAVSAAKPLIRNEMINDGTAISYYEPESKVVSRSGDECVAALVDQWYLKYGEAEWKAKVQSHVENVLDTYNPIAKDKFLGTIAWLHEWACSRTFGLGTQLPWDTQFVIESLSDSTIYMAYYTISHYLQAGIASMDGSMQGSANSAAALFTDEVFDYIFLQGGYPSQCGIAEAILESMRKEFNYWYPVDLRVSGKDLIGNHLTMSLYNHAAIWGNDPSKWPRSFFTNGHSLLNDNKMSKSTGNFMTLKDAIDLFGADATRFALADAGDGLEDANFTVKTANAAILRLTKEDEWINEIISSLHLMRDGEADFLEQVFLNDINRSIIQTKEAMSKMQFREALKHAVFTLHNCRDFYRASCQNGLHRQTVLRYIEVSIILISPFCPHWAQKKWSDIGKDGFVVDAGYPTPVGEYSAELSFKTEYIKKLSHDLRLGADSRSSSKKGSGAKGKPNSLCIYIATVYPDWQKAVLSVLKKHWDEFGSLPGKHEVSSLLKTSQDIDKKQFGPAMAFAASVSKDFEENGVQALQTETPFDELEVVNKYLDIITRDLEIPSISVYDVNDCSAPGLGKKSINAVPGHPAFAFSSL